MRSLERKVYLYRDSGTKHLSGTEDYERNQRNKGGSDSVIKTQRAKLKRGGGTGGQEIGPVYIRKSVLV